MKLNNHVHNKLKKRYLKKFTSDAIPTVEVFKGIPDICQPNIKYYKLIDILRKDCRVCPSVHRYLSKRLRIKSSPSLLSQNFTGKLSRDFIWDSTEDGHDFWNRMHKWAMDNYQEFYVFNI